MIGTEVAIAVAGDLPGTVLLELEGFVARRHDDVVVLRGQVADQAALIGVLGHLHASGLLICDLGPARGAEPPLRCECPPRGRRSVVEVRVDGLVAELLGSVVEGAELHENPATTTLRVPMENPGALFPLLVRIEAFSLEVREIHRLVPVERGS